MATTSPNNLPSPDLPDPYAPLQAFGNLAAATQTALNQRANMYVGTTAARTAWIDAPEGTHWQDSNGTRQQYIFQSNAWVNPWQDTGWINCSLAPGRTMQGTSLPQVRRIGKLVKVRWGINGEGIAVSTTYDAFQLPAGFYASGRTSYFPVVTNSANHTARATVSPSGMVTTVVSGGVPNYIIFDAVSFFLD